jgi:group I intron endonuclease
MGYIYKITNTITGKCYIGETIQHDYKKRWQKHLNCLKYKEGCPLLKSSMKKHGIENFKFEILIICFDQDLVRYEKEYIKKYNSQVPNGYNILSGGQIGDGMLGYKHTPETIEKIKQKGKAFREKNPNHFETYREKLRCSMEKVDLSSCIKNSVKFQKAIEEKRVGSASHKGGKLSEETKKKIKESLTKYYENNTNPSCNIDKHRDIMSKKCGKIVIQLSVNGEFVNEYPSISEAARAINVNKHAIQNALTKPNRKSGGFIWKYKNSDIPIKSTDNALKTPS